MQSNRPLQLSTISDFLPNSIYYPAKFCAITGLVCRIVLRTRAHTQIHTHTHTYTHIHTHTHTYLHIHTHTYTYTHILTHTHINTHTHTQFASVSQFAQVCYLLLGIRLPPLAHSFHICLALIHNNKTTVRWF